MSNENRLWLLLPLETYYEGYCYDEGISKSCNLLTQKSLAIAVLDIISYDFEEIKENGVKLIKMRVMRKNKKHQSEQKIVENYIYLSMEQYSSLLSPSSHEINMESKIDYWRLTESYDDDSFRAIDFIMKKKTEETQSITNTIKQILTHEPFSS